jgi:Flp pilus assembly CpaF family ATPase
MTNILLNAWLEPLQPCLNRPDLIELSANQAGEVLLEFPGIGYVTETAPSLTTDYWEKLCHVLANIQGLYFDVIKQPKLSVMLPGGHRFEAMLGNNVASTLSISIRMRRTIHLGLEQFGLTGELQARVLEMIKQGANVLISGGTSSGKTTFMNRLVQEIPLDKRVLVVEDTREIHVPHHNRQYYLLSRNEDSPTIDYPKMIDHLMRSRPDMIIMGELSMANAYPILRLLNSGHAGFMCTLHANTPASALEWAIPQNIAFSGHDLSGVKDFLYEAVDLVLQLHRTADGKRRITDVLFPKTGEHIQLEDGH